MSQYVPPRPDYLRIRQHLERASTILGGSPKTDLALHLLEEAIELAIELEYSHSANDRSAGAPVLRLVETRG